MNEKLHPLVPLEEQWPGVSQVMQACFSFAPEPRPSFDSICVMLAKDETFYIGNHNPVNGRYSSQADSADYISKFLLFVMLIIEYNN